MTYKEFEQEFARLGDNYKTADVDRFIRELIKRKEDVTFLRDVILEKQQYHRIYYKVSMAQIDGLDGKMKFIEDNFDKLQDWWHVDQLPQFMMKVESFEPYLQRAKEYINNEMPFVRRWGYVMFMPRLVRCDEAPMKLFNLFKDDEEYYVQMAEGWLISYLAIYHPEETYEYLKKCELKYNIVGKGIQKICDSYRISDEWKSKFREIRGRYKK